MFIKRRVDPRLRSKSLGPHDSDDEEPSKTDGKQKAPFRPYQGIKPPLQSILKKPSITIIQNNPPPISAIQTPMSAPAVIAQQQQLAFQLYSDGNRVYVGPPQPPEAAVASSSPAPPPSSRHPSFSRPRPRPYPPAPKRQENPANYRIYPTNAKKTLLKAPSITKIGFDPPPQTGLTASSITFQGFKPPTNSEPYNPIRPPTIPFGVVSPSASTAPSSQVPINPNPSILIRPPPLFSTLPSTNNDDEIEAIRIVKHPIMKHHRAGGGQDIRKFREIFAHKKDAVLNSSSTEILSPTHSSESRSESAMKTDTAGHSQDTVGDQCAVANVEGNQKDTVVEENVSLEIQKIPTAETQSVPFGFALDQAIQEINQPKTLNPSLKETVTVELQQPIIVIDDTVAPSHQIPSTSKSKQKPGRSREDGELSRSPTPEIITIDDSDDEIIEIKDSSPPSRYKGQTALGLDLYLNNLGKADEEPLGGVFFDMKLFYQHYEEILKTLVKENQERTAYCHGIIDQLCEIGAGLEVFFLMSGDVLEESRADEEFSEIQIYIASISDDKNVDITLLMEPVYNVIKDSNIGIANFYSNTNVIVIIQGENNIAVRPLDKLAWARSSLVSACGNRVPLFKDALLLIKKAIRQFRTSEKLSDFVISFALIQYLQHSKNFPVFDYDLDEIDVVGAIDVIVLKQPTKKANEIFSDFLFFIKHNENLTIECPFTKEQLDIKDTLLTPTIDQIFGIQS